MVLIAILIGLAVFLAATGIWLMVGGQSGSKSQIQLRLQGVRQIKAYELGSDLAQEQKKKDAARAKKKEVLKKKAFSDIPVLDRKLKATPWAERLSAQLRQANLPLTVSTFMLICLAAGMFALSLTVLWRGRFDPLVAPLATLLIGAVPYAYVRFAVRRRLKKFCLQFPDALDLLSSSVKGGLSINAAVQNVADEMPDPTSEEFGIMADELAFGVELSEALRHLAARVPTPDIKFFTTAVMIQKETGGNLSEILDLLQTTIRERFRILGQVRTLTAQARMSGWVLGALPVALAGMIYMANPVYMRLLFVTETGHKLLAAAGVLQLIGLMIIRKIVNIKV